MVRVFSPVRVDIDPLANANESVVPTPISDRAANERQYGQRQPRRLICP